MTDILTIVGRVATVPVKSVTASGVAVTNFRVATKDRRFDSVSNSWVDGATNWFSVAAFRHLAEHAHNSLQSGDAVIVTGRLKIRDWESNGKHGTSVDIEADAIGHDLRWGSTTFERAPRTAAPRDAAAAEGQSGSAGAMSSSGDAAEATDDGWANPMESGGDADATPF